MLNFEDDLCFSLYIVSKEIVKQYTPYLKELNLTYTQFITLSILWNSNENFTVKELGEKLALDSGTLTPLLKNLEKKELIIRNRSNNDERKLIISLTKKGKNLQEKAKSIPIKVCKCLGLPSNEKKEVISYLNKIMNYVEKEKEN